MKSKRRNTPPPRCDYDYHVDHSQLEHPCHHYVWSDVFYPDKGKDTIPILIAYAGWKPKQEFLEDSIWEPKGTKEGGWTASVDARKCNKFWLRDMRTFIHKARALVMGFPPVVVLP